MYGDAPRRDVQLLLAAGVPHERIQELTGASVRTIHRIGREAVTAELTAASAAELAALYHERWEIETTYDEIKTHILGRAPILRTKTPALVRQEIEGLMLAHYAVRHFLYEAAHEADEDPDRLSFTHAVQVIRRIQNPGAFPPKLSRRGLEQAIRDEILEERCESSRGQAKPHGIKRKMSKFKLRLRGPLSRQTHDWVPRIIAPNP